MTTIHIAENADTVCKAELMLKITEVLGPKGDIMVIYGNWIWESGSQEENSYVEIGLKSGQQLVDA
eukprot:6616335-Prorocentrum_lima.AAC.1